MCIRDSNSSRLEKWTRKRVHTKQLLFFPSKKEYENQIWNGIKFNKFPNSQAGRETLRKGLYGILVVVIKFQIGYDEGLFYPSCKVCR